MRSPTRPSPVACVVTIVLTCMTGAVSAWTGGNAAVPPSLFRATVRRETSSVLSMASRGALKWKRKQAWLEKRGLGAGDGDDDSTPTGGDGALLTIVGGGRIGSMLAEAADEGETALLLRRGDPIPADGAGPIVVATRNDSLEGIVASCPEGRRKDLVFVQNGYLDGFLEGKGLSDNTQVLLFVSVTALGADPVDGVTAVNPEGLTTATGEHAQAFADRLAALGLKCNVVDKRGYTPRMFEKLIWISSLMLVGTAKGCASVGEAQSKHATLLQNLIAELVMAVQAKENVVFSPGVADRLFAYTDVVSDFPCAVKEFEWRNQYFYGLKKADDGENEGEGEEACPIHNGLLRECRENGSLGFDLP